MTDISASTPRADGLARQTLSTGMRRPFGPEFHAECDVAALVYRPADDPDTVLAAFICDLCKSGVDAVGLLQRRNSGMRGIGEPVEFFLLPEEDGQRPRFEPPASAVRSCGTQLQDLGARLELVLQRRPDIIVLNRFGWLEVGGSGLLSTLGEAIEHDVPVAIAVPLGLFDRWLTVTQGLAVRLSCDRPSLDRWWNGVRRTASAAPPEATFCERYK